MLITPLFETPMPFVRYDIGDLAQSGGAPCPCGRSLGTLTKILGRIGEVYYTREGHRIEPNFWCIVFEAGKPSEDVEKFQIVYRPADRILIRIVPQRGYSAATEAELRKFLEKNLPNSLSFEFEYVPEIRLQPSGKHQFVVNEKKEEGRPMPV